MRRFFIYFVIALLFLFQLILKANAEMMTAPINCACSDVKLYGNEKQNKIQEDATNPDEKKCYLKVDIESIKPPPSKNGIMENIGEGVLEAAKIPLKFLQLFEPLFSKIPIKKYLPDLVRELFEQHTVLYHNFLDEQVFGNAIAAVSAFEKSKDLEKQLKKWEEEDGCKNPKNPKPACVIKRAMCNYEKYAGALFQEAGASLSRSAISKDKSEELQVLLSMTQKRDQALLEEAKNSQEALDTAIAVYSQFYNTYSLHLKLKELITAFVKIRNRTSEMRTLVECIPNKFKGTATTKCN